MDASKRRQRTLDMDEKCAPPFNLEIEKRVLERLGFYLGDMVSANLLIANFIENGGFTFAIDRNSKTKEGLLTAAHRDAYLALAYSLPQTLVYVGLEDGAILGNYWDYGYYREPGNSGYRINTSTNNATNGSMQKHWKSCVDKTTGEAVDCTLIPGDPYVKCNGGRDELQSEAEEASGLCNEMELCPDEASQRDCSPLQNGADTTAYQECMNAKKWCRQYSIQTANEDENLGMIPITNSCLDKHGQFTQEKGKVTMPFEGNCVYGDGETLVQRRLSGDYAYCQQPQQSNTCTQTTTASTENEVDPSAISIQQQPQRLVCDTTFVGGYESINYDPRYRPWYSATKELQIPNWTLYPFFALGLGITYSHPIYHTIGTGNEGERQQVFAGVLAIDYRIEDIAQFLVDSYGNTSTSVVIYEDAAPHYVIGTSTGSDVAQQMLVSSNLTLPCPLEDFTNNVRQDVCTAVRLSVTEMSSDYMDVVQARAFERHTALGYPQELLSVNGPPSLKSGDRGSLFMSQSAVYEQEGAHGLKWRILITSPAQQSTSDAVTVENSPTLFASICVIAGLGCAICALLCYLFYGKRTERAVMVADWRFTCAFISGCALLNVAMFTQLGQNTNATCLLRMWSFHVCFVVALAPLFVKVWRIRQLVGMPRMRRKAISNTQAALYTLPMILLQVVILMIISFVDPPKPTELIESTGSLGGGMVQSIVCDTNTHALLIAQMIFEGGLVLVGCILAYLSRNMNSEFGEARQLIFAMYNIALVAMIVVLVLTVADVDPNGQSVFSVVGVFWGTVFSSAAFVLPRMVQVRRAQRSSSAPVPASGRSQTGARAVCHISGIEAPGPHVEEKIDSPGSSDSLVVSNKSMSEDDEDSPSGSSGGSDNRLLSTDDVEQGASSLAVPRPKGNEDVKVSGRVVRWEDMMNEDCKESKEYNVEDEPVVSAVNNVGAYECGAKMANERDGVVAEVVIQKASVPNQ